MRFSVVMTNASRTPIELDIGSGELVPAILQFPPKRPRGVAAVVLLHGFSSQKERMANSFGRALLAHGVASIAIDLPLHGAREAGIEGMSLRNPLALVQKWRLAVREANHAIHYLVERDEIDACRVGIAGYSLGAYLSVTVASKNKFVRAVALAAGGDLPEETPFASIARTIADPQRAVRSIAGRPLCMINGRYDQTIRPAQARSLFDAATEPKELHWYNGGHWPPQPVIDQTAAGLAERLSEPRAHARPA